jgi:hypothetical protein
MTEQRTVFVHGSNLKQKEAHKTKYRDVESRQYLTEIRTRYDQWHEQNMNLIGPTTKQSNDDIKTVAARVQLLEDYKNFIDSQQYAEKFDSRSNLHSSVLEEFLYYLFKDLLSDFGSHALIGKSHAFKDMFFVPPNYSEMLKRPYAKIEIKDHDFVIGATVEATFRSSTPPDEDETPGETFTLRAQEPDDYEEVGIKGNTETHLFDIPIVAIECKTYLDKTMLEGSSRAAEELKTRSPNALYIVVMEWLKLTDAVNLRKYKVDQIYVLRKQKNIDREFRFDEGYVKNSVDIDVVWHLFNTVREHLTIDWKGGLNDGIQRGWLI